MFGRYGPWLQRIYYRMWGWGWISFFFFLNKISSDTMTLNLSTGWCYFHYLGKQARSTTNTFTFEYMRTHVKLFRNTFEFPLQNNGCAMRVVPVISSQWKLKVFYSKVKGDKGVPRIRTFVESNLWSQHVLTFVPQHRTFVFSFTTIKVQTFNFQSPTRLCLTDVFYFI